MKQLFFIAIIFSIIFISSCNKSLTSNGNGFNQINGFDSVSRPIAIQMIKHYIDTPIVDHTLDSTIMRIYLTRGDMKWLIKNKKTAEVNLFFAAYLSSNSDPAVRHKPTILFQQKKYINGGADSVFTYYDISKPSGTALYITRRICPQPPCKTIPIE